MKARIGSGVSSGNGAGMLASADFHGMEVEVVRCIDLGRVGCRGIVVRETRSTVTIVCDEKEDLKKSRRDKGWRGKIAGGNGDEDTSKRMRTEELDKVRMIMKKGTFFRVVIALPTEHEDVDGGNSNESGEDGEMKDDSKAAAAEKPKKQLMFELHGDQLEIRPIERAVKKFKWKAMDYL